MRSRIAVIAALAFAALVAIPGVLSASDPDPATPAASDVLSACDPEPAAPATSDVLSACDPEPAAPAASVAKVYPKRPVTMVRFKFSDREMEGRLVAETKTSYRVADMSGGVMGYPKAKVTDLARTEIDYGTYQELQADNLFEASHETRNPTATLFAARRMYLSSLLNNTDPNRVQSIRRKIELVESERKLLHTEALRQEHMRREKANTRLVEAETRLVEAETRMVEMEAVLAERQIADPYDPYNPYNPYNSCNSYNSYNPHNRTAAVAKGRARQALNRIRLRR